MNKNKYKVPFFLIALFIYLTSFAQFSGTYNVGGSSPDFKNLDSAFNNLERKGVKGAVRLNVRSGTYNLQTAITNINGLGGTKIINVAPDPKNTSPVIFKNNNPSGFYNFMVSVKQGYIRFDSVQFRLDSASKGGRIFDITGACESIVFNACTFFGKDTALVSNNWAIIYNPVSIHVNNIKVFNCTFYNGSYAVYNAGNQFETGFEFINNKVYRFAKRAIYSTYATSPVIQGNYMIGNGRSATDGIYLETFYSLILKDNQVYLHGGDGNGNGKAVYLRTALGSITLPNIVANNFISVYDTNGNYPSCGVYIEVSNKYTYIYNNTILNRNSSPESKSIYIDNTIASQNTILQNNCIVNEGKGWAIYLVTLDGISAMDNNNYYSTGPNFAYLVPKSSNYSDMSEWISDTGKDSASINKSVTFKSPIDLHTVSIELNSKGKALNEVDKDIDGATRHSGTPDIGADEFTPPGIDASLAYILTNYCNGAQDVMVKIKNQGEDTIKSVKVYWSVSVNGGSYKTQATYNYSAILKSGNDTLVKIGAYTFSDSNKYKIKSWTSDPNSGKDAYTGNDTLVTASLATSLGGTYTVGGSSPNFSTIDSAFIALEQRGVCGPVRLNLRSGTYNEQIEINSIPNSNGVNTITLGPDPSNKIMPVIIYSNTIPNDNYVINFKNTSWVKIDSIKILSLDTTHGRVIVFEGTNSNITLLGDSIITGEKWSVFNELVYSDYRNTNDRTNYITIKDCKLINGYFAIYLYGASDFNREKGNKFINNKIAGSAYGGIYSSRHENLEISFNSIEVTHEGLDFWACNFFDVRNNIIHIKSEPSNTNGQRGIMFYFSDGNLERRCVLANNSVSIYKTNGPCTGIGLEAVSYSKILYNSVNLTSGTASSTALYLYPAEHDSVEIFNNSFVNFGKGYASYISDLKFAEMRADFNNYFTRGSIFASFGGLNAYTFNDLKSASKLDANSISVNPKYKDSSYLKPRYWGMNDKGIPLSYLSKDITGAIRSMNKPDIGAYEFDPVLNDMGVVKISNSKINTCRTDFINIGAVINNLADTAQSNFKVFVKITDGKSFSMTDSVLYTKKLKPYMIDSVFFKKLSTLNGGVFTIKAYTGLANDQDHTNDTLTKVLSVFAVSVPVVKADTICNNVVHYLEHKTIPYHSIKWYDAKNLGKLIAENDSLVIKNLTKDTIFYTTYTSESPKCESERVPYYLRVYKVPIINIGKDTSYCANSGINKKLDAGSGFSYKWSTGDSTQTITVNSAGKYTVEVADSNKCYGSDTINVSINNIVTVNLGKDTGFCQKIKISYKLDAGPGFNSYLWSTNETKQSITVTSEGRYSVIVKDTKTCEGADSITIARFSNPLVNLGNDTSYCINNGINKKLDAGTGYSYKWSNGAASQSISVNTAGVYYVEIKDKNTCLAFDTIKVTANLNPVVNLGTDRKIKPPINETLDAGSGFKKYVWSNGAQTQIIKVNVEGKYFVKVSDNNGCEGSDTIVITKDQLGIATLKADNFKIYPNPARGILTFVSKSGAIEKIEIYEINGKLLYKDVINSLNHSLSTVNWANGIYQLKISSNGFVYNFKILVQH